MRLLSTFNETHLDRKVTFGIQYLISSGPPICYLYRIGMRHRWDGTWECGLTCGLTREWVRKDLAVCSMKSREAKAISNYFLRSNNECWLRGWWGGLMACWKGRVMVVTREFLPGRDIMLWNRRAFLAATACNALKYRGTRELISVLRERKAKSLNLRNKKSQQSLTMWRVSTKVKKLRFSSRLGNPKYMSWLI